MLDIQRLQNVGLRFGKAQPGQEGRPLWRTGGRGQLALAFGQVLHDGAGLEDHLAVDLQRGHPSCWRQRAEFGAAQRPVGQRPKPDFGRQPQLFQKPQHAERPRGRNMVQTDHRPPLSLHSPLIVVR